MEKWQLAGIFSAEPRPKLDLTQIGILRKKFRSEHMGRTSSAPTQWLENTWRKLTDVITLF